MYHKWHHARLLTLGLIARFVANSRINAKFIRLMLIRCFRFSAWSGGLDNNFLKSEEIGHKVPLTERYSPLEGHFYAARDPL